MKRAAAALLIVLLTGCTYDAPGVYQPLPYANQMPVRCANGHWAHHNVNIRNDTPCQRVWDSYPAYRQPTF